MNLFAYDFFCLLSSVCFLLSSSVRSHRRLTPENYSHRCRRFPLLRLSEAIWREPGTLDSKVPKVLTIHRVKNGLSQEPSEITNRLCPVQKAKNQGNESCLNLPCHRRCIWGFCFASRQLDTRYHLLIQDHWIPPQV